LVMRLRFSPSGAAFFCPSPQFLSNSSQFLGRKEIYSDPNSADPNSADPNSANSAT